MSPQEQVNDWNKSLVCTGWKAEYREQQEQYVLLFNGQVTVEDNGNGYAVWASISRVIGGLCREIGDD